MSAFLLPCFLTAALLTQTPHLSITQRAGKTIDREIRIQVEQLDPLQEIELRVEVEDQRGEPWSSHAVFQADVQGSVDVASAQPIKNSSYEGVDEMGLFWSMLPASGDASSIFKCKNDTVSVGVKLYVDGYLAAQETVVWYLKDENVKRIDVREDGLVGALFVPQSEKPLPVIITISGSNGGLSENRAKLLASNGFAVFALGYFGVDGLPPNLQDIPLEYFEVAFAWLKAQPYIEPSHIGLYGASRGAELSLLLGSFFPNSVQAIVAIAPSSVVYGGSSDASINAWIYQGKPILPFAPVPQIDFTQGQGQTPENPACIRASFLEGIKDESAFTDSSIPVENIRCPILLVSGGGDQMWPSDFYVQQIMDRLQKNHSSITCRHLHYPEAGHGINIPNLPIPGPVYYHPVAKLWFSMGGTRSADAKASSDAWNKLVAFFHEFLMDSTNKMQQSNREKFSVLRGLKLPNDQYAVTGSGPLGIRNLKAIGDVDIIVTHQLWIALAKKYGVTDENGVEKIVFPGGIVEAFWEGSFYTAPKDLQAPTIAARIKDAEIIDGLPFDSIENVLYYKRKDAREKDLKDIVLIEEWASKQKT